MEWYEIIETFGVYSINKLGLIRNNNTNNISIGGTTSQGYREIRYRKFGKTVYRRLIHIIVAEMFIQKPTDGDYVVDHIDNNKNNNKLENLRYITRAQNFDRGQEHRNKINCCRRVNQYDKDWNFIATYNSIAEACDALGVGTGPMIGYVCRGRCSTNNCETAYGFRWKFVDDDIVRFP